MKNTLRLENYGVASLTTREMKTTDGGGWWRAAIHGETCSGTSGYKNCTWVKAVANHYDSAPMYN